MFGRGNWLVICFIDPICTIVEFTSKGDIHDPDISQINESSETRVAAKTIETMITNLILDDTNGDS